MFDGLKDKLNSFTSDVEEDAEVAEADETEAADATAAQADDADVTEAESTDATVAQAGDADVTEADADDATAKKAEPAEEPEAATVQPSPDDGPEATESGGAGPAAETAHPDTEAAAETGEAEPAADASSEASDDEGRGLAERAKLFATGKTVIDEDDLEAHLEELEFALLGSDVEMSVAQEILDQVEQNLVGETRRRLQSTGNLATDALREALYDVISVGQFDFDERIAAAEKPVTIIFTGVNGVGKTTTIAKLAHYLEQRGYSSVLANGDTFRAGANEQLEQHADALGKKIISHEQGSDPAAVIYDAVEYAEANGVDVVLGDTAGRLHTSDGLMDQLSKIDRVIEPDMTLFVDEAVAGQDAVNRAREFNDAAEIDGTVLTKADADQQGGAAISIAYVTGKPILFLGTGQDYDDIDQFDPERIVDALLRTE